ncbi:DUF302 domain-containing protein [Balneolales bacterium ANBcel1]|nr:DUF302 domain-containing protein [Balneolales bacterium ANBcel1]
MIRISFYSGIAGLAAALLIIILSGFGKSETPGMMEDASPYDFETTIDRFETAVDEAGWGIITTHNMQQMMQRHGHEVNKIKIFEVCSARYSAEVLKLDDERIITPLMPCRIAIYEKSDGVTYISRMDHKAIARPYGGVIYDVMTKATRDMEMMIAQVVE